MIYTATSFTRHVWYTLVVLAGMVGTFSIYVASEKTIDAVNEKRLESFLLVDELRQSSDDLTRMARLYAVTGNPLYRRNFEHILAIRDGQRPRPERYDSIYWDLVNVDGVPPRMDSGRAVALIDLMRSAGFTEEELSVLERSKALSDELTRVEREAMRLRDVQGAAAAASHAQALALLHDNRYMEAKAAILRPIDQFYILITERSNQAVARATANALIVRVLFIAFGLVLMLMLYRTSRALRAVLGGSVEAVDAQIARIGQGDFSAPAPGLSQEAPPGTVLARVAETRVRLQHLDEARQQAQAQLQASEQRLKEAQRLALLGNWEFDLPTRQLHWSDEVYRIFEIQPDRFTPTYEAFMTRVHPQDRDAVHQSFADTRAPNIPRELTHRVCMADGRVKHLNERIECICDADGRVLRTFGTVQDVTAVKLGEQELKRLNRDLRLLSHCNMALVRADDEERLLEQVCRLCVESGGYLMAWVGYAEQDEARSVRPMAQAGCEQGYLDSIDICWADNERGCGPTGLAIRTGQAQVIQNILGNPAMQPWRDAALQRGYQSSVALPLVSDNRVLGALNLYSREPEVFNAEELRLLTELAGDLAYGIMALRTRAEHAAAKERLGFLAHFDPLTHLPNRTLLRDRFEQAALLCTPASGARVVLLYIDLDHFTQVNDSLGYAVGDEVIVQVVQRLRLCMPATATISRLSGDEFAVLLTDRHDAPALVGLADAIRETLNEPVQARDHTLNMSCSIGIGVYPADAQDFDTLLKQAHTAMDSAKEAGRNTYRFFRREMNAGLAEQIRLTGALTQALRQHEFLLHYQPQIDLRSGHVIGVEALVRWQHPTEGLVPPGKFIALAERSGHIVPLGEWVLREACHQGRRWMAQFPRPPIVAVNLSALQFKRGNVLALVRSALDASGLRPDLLELELTESILLQDIEATMLTLQELKALGVKLSIDDFGTGYSSLSYLKRLSVDKIKIDQSFVWDMQTEADGDSIVRAIVQLGHNLQLRVIAEGVETAGQLSLLAALGCDEVQGYWFSRPVPADQLGPLLTQGFRPVR